MPKQDLISISGSERQPVARTLLPSVNHFVVVMLENRSFDHMLGFLYAAQGNVSPLSQPFEGLTGNETNPDGKGGRVKVFKILPTDPHPYFMPGANPGEGYLNTNWQLFGTEKAPVPIVPSTNQGFVTNFAATLAWESKQARDASCKIYTAPSIYSLLEKNGKSWSIYGYNAPRCHVGPWPTLPPPRRIILDCSLTSSRRRSRARWPITSSSNPAGARPEIASTRMTMCPRANNSCTTSI